MFNSVAVSKWLKSEERSAAWLARRCGVSRNTMSRALAGEVDVRGTMLAKIASVTGLPINVLLASDGDLRQQKVAG